jgi:transglutaminase-like putative cysteine protease
VEKFVYNYIQKKSYGIPLISASDILQSRSGDCTEHSVLAVSLLRALKIPARALFGLVYEKKYQAQKNIFIFHMWVEAYYQKKWNLIDATRSGAKKLNHYLALGYHDLQTATPLSYLKTMATIQNLKISYVP